MHTRSGHPAFLAAALTAGWLLASPARASDPNPDELPWKRAGIFLGGQITGFDSTVRLGSDAAGAGLEINLEDAFGLETSNEIYRFGGYWRFGDSRRHKLTFDYYQAERSADKTLEEDVTVGDTTYPEGTHVSTKVSMGVLKASYSYSFLFDDRIDLSAAFGIYTLPMKFEFDGLTNEEKSDFTAPLPVFGLHADFALTPELFLRQRIDLFYLEYGDFSGGLADIYLGVEWYPWEHFGLGLGVESFRLGLKAENGDYASLDLDGTVKVEQNGLFLYLTYAF